MRVRSRTVLDGQSEKDHESNSKLGGCYCSSNDDRRLTPTRFYSFRVVHCSARKSVNWVTQYEPRPSMASATTSLDASMMCRMSIMQSS